MGFPTVCAMLTEERLFIAGSDGKICMIRLQSIGIETISAAVILVPVLLLGKRMFHENRKKVLYYIMFALYLTAVYAVVGLPSVNYLRFDFNYNFIPFMGIIDDLTNSILNVILFIPLGVVLPLFWAKYSSIKRVLLYAFGMSLTIEILQVFTFRATDVNDLITNTAGGAAGYGMAKFCTKMPIFKSTYQGGRAARIIHRVVMDMYNPDRSGRDLYLINGIVLFVMFFIQPFIAPVLWDMVL